MPKQKSLIVVVGPTAVGKTAMAIELAKYFKTEIISADSRQFYQELNIGTAKPSLEELKEAKHHFINSHLINEIYSAGDYERDALDKLEELFKEKDVVIAVGGSGLFIKALTEGLDNLPKAPEGVREKLNAKFAEEGLDSLKQRLFEIDPEYYLKVDLDNPQRVIRAIEVFEASGKPISYFLKNSLANRSFEVHTIGLNTDRSILYERINNRVDIMMDQGLLKEVESLVSFRNMPALLTVGYAELFDYLEGKMNLQEAIDVIKQNSRRYAKRQITWFKKYGNTVWFEPNEFSRIISHLKDLGVE